MCLFPEISSSLFTNNDDPALLPNVGQHLLTFVYKHRHSETAGYYGAFCCTPRRAQLINQDIDMASL